MHLLEALRHGSPITARRERSASSGSLVRGAALGATHVRFATAANFLPERKATSSDVEDRIAKASPALRMRRGLIKARTGILERRYLGDDTQASDLGVGAAKKALAQSSLSPSDVDLLVWASASQDLVEPATAHIVAAKLGLKCPVFDVKNACNSWLNGVQVATALVRTGQYQNALVVTGESPSRAVRWTVDGLRDLFASAAGYTMGDAGAAAVLTFDPTAPGIYYQDFRAMSEHWDIATLPGGGSMHPRGDEYSYFSGDGGKLRDAFRSFGPSIVHDALAATKSRYEDFARIFCHQVTLPFLDVFLESTKIPKDRLVVTVPTHGNIASATMPTQLAYAIERGEVKRGDKVMFVGLGGGLSMGVMLAEM